MSNDLKKIIEQAFEQQEDITPSNCTEEFANAISDCMMDLSHGKLRTAEKIDGQWVTHNWIKKAVLLSMKTSLSQLVDSPLGPFYDKIPLKYRNYSPEDFKVAKIRAVPGAIARHGCYIGPNTVIMPSFVNIGAYVDEGTLIDTWATVGSCAQIGKNVHLSGGAGIGGVLEPLQASPTIIEDNCFIGARSEIVEGVIVEKNSVISMGVFIGQSTKIYNREKDEVTYGRIPEGSVVVPGSLPSKNGKCNLCCAVIVKQVDEQTRRKTTINELLRS